ncbi:type II secretion system secretin GspD [Pleionea sp. CnH1-48]|uniref:type II secretion system secretin GspD n=1 Tax=Pleionea sp. CnH1-48 TaxID=2954494 RepID=UPI00209750DE|nr:type II secretion system secretin GspD [Pleionea sp. CnH1-48]MCO7225204.1 type II secretion system secretin GspD [Pleionea sp. CnH1-48]
MSFKSREKSGFLSAARHWVALGLCALMIPVHAEKATINLKDTDIRVFIESVSRLTGKTIIVGQRVKNQKVTVLSQKPLDESEIWGVFLSVLKLHGFGAVEDGDVIKVISDQEAKADASIVFTGREKGIPSDQQVTRVVKVENVEVTQLVPVLRQLIPQKMHLGQIRATNVLLIHDTRANVERIVKVIKQIDYESNEEIEVIELKHAAASEVVRILETLQKQGQQKDVSASKPRFVADERTNSILLSAEKQDRLRLRALIVRLDTKNDDAGNTKVVYLNYAKAQDVAQLLEGVGETINTEDGKAKAQKRRSSGKEYSIKAHEDTNSLVITAQPDLLRSFEAVIRQLDIRRAQVHVEALIVEISDNRAKELGVQWLFGGSGSGAPVGLTQFGNTGVPITNVGAGVAALQGQETGGETVVDGNGNATVNPVRRNGDNGAALAQVLGAVQGMAFGFGQSDSNGDLQWAALIRALGSDTESNVLSTPSITTLDNEEATISVGQEIPIVTGSALGNNNSNPFTTTDRKDVGVKLKITPLINEGSSVRLKIEQEVSSIAGATGQDIITNKREINTTVQVDDGGLVVLGGLIDEDIQESSQKVPLLGDIPFLGQLFRSERTTKTKRNLMVFIRPKILRDDKSIHELSSSKYNYIRARQLDMRSKGISLMEGETPLLPEFDDALALPPGFDESIKEKQEDE